MKTPIRSAWTIGTAVALVVATECAQARQCGSVWQVIPGQTGNPSARSAFAYAYDSARDRIVLHGGVANGVGSHETWEFVLSNGVWLHIASGEPTPRTGATMAYDSVRQVCVLVGGRVPAAGPVIAETWEYDSPTWTLAGAGAAATDIALAFHPTLNQVVRLGGWNGDPQGVQYSFAAWNGAVWTELPGHEPGVFSSSLAFFPSDGRLHQTGGFTCCGPGGVLYFDFDSRAWNGAIWTLTSGSRGGSFLMHDAARERLLCFDSGRMQEWNNINEWIPLETGNGLTHADLYDPVRDRLLGFRNNAGVLELWERSTDPVPTQIVGHSPAPGTIVEEYNDTLVLRIDISGGVPTLYQWRRDGAPLLNGAGVTGVNTRELRVEFDTCEDYGVYDVLVQRAPCPPVLSQAWTVIPPPASFGLQPQSASTGPNSSVQFRVMVFDPVGEPAAYQWRQNGQPVPNAAPYSGSQTAMLTIDPTPFAFNGDQFDVVVTRACGGMVTSDPATLTVVCAGDTNGDGVVNFADLNIVLSQFGQSGPGLQGDVVADGVVNFADLNLVLSLFGVVC